MYELIMLSMSFPFEWFGIYLNGELQIQGKPRDIELDIHVVRAIRKSPGGIRTALALYIPYSQGVLIGWPDNDGTLPFPKRFADIPDAVRQAMVTADATE